MLECSFRKEVTSSSQGYSFYDLLTIRTVFLFPLLNDFISFHFVLVLYRLGCRFVSHIQYLQIVNIKPLFAAEVYLHPVGLHRHGNVHLIVTSRTYNVGQCTKNREARTTARQLFCCFIQTENLHGSDFP